MYAPTGRDNWLCCYYEFQASVSYGGKTVSLKQNQIVSLMLEKNYDAHHMPILIIELSLDTTDKDGIKKNPNSILHLRADKCIGVDKDRNIRITSKSIYLNSTFAMIDLDDTPKSDYYKNLVNGLKTRRRDSDDYLLYSTGQSCKYILVRKNDLTASKYIHNAVLTKATLTETLGMLLTSAGCSNILMANLDNTTEYEELIIPPLPLLECIRYLQNMYGFHKEDTTVFMDFDTMYIVRKSGLCTVYKNRETKNVTFCLNAPENMNENQSGVIYAGNTTYVNIGPKHFTRDIGGAVSNQVKGTDYLIYNEDERASQQVTVENERSINKNNTNVVTIKGHNNLISSQLKYRKYEEQYKFTIGSSGEDLSILTPNKQYSIISNCTEIAVDVMGKYRLTRQVTTFARTGQYFIPASTLTLRKTME